MLHYDKPLTNDEIILVVIGILIALQINNSNQNRVNESKTSTHVIAFANETISHFFMSYEQNTIQENGCTI